MRRKGVKPSRYFDFKEFKKEIETNKNQNKGKYENKKKEEEEIKSKTIINANYENVKDLYERGPCDVKYACDYP